MEQTSHEPYDEGACAFHTTVIIILNLELSADARRFLLGVQMEQGSGRPVVLREAHDGLQRLRIYEILYRKE